MSPLDNEAQWKQLIENRINRFDNKLNDLVDILKTNQKVLLEQQMAYQKQIPYQQAPHSQNTLQNGEHNYGSMPFVGLAFSDECASTKDETLHYINLS